MPANLPDLSTTFGPRLKRLREAAGFTQARLARASGVALGTIQQLEGKRSEPSLDSARHLASALGIDVNALLGDPEPPPLPRSSTLAVALREPPPPGYKPIPTRRERVNWLLGTLDERELAVVETLLEAYEGARAKAGT
ncbi:MAG TPA: helix-turn-helix transcriptional regulator [Planctomycetota bacterium]|nr:helix-turn-helix transcriptional regulator [Planctomycetota bacterium]